MRDRRRTEVETTALPDR